MDSLDEKSMREAQKEAQAALSEGGGYQSKGVSSPAENCRMKTNEAPAFCPVCQRAIERIIRIHSNPR